MSKAKQTPPRLSKLKIKSFKGLIIVSYTQSPFRHISLNKERVKAIGLDSALVLKIAENHRHIARHVNCEEMRVVYINKLQDCIAALEVLRASK